MKNVRLFYILFVFIFSLPSVTLDGRSRKKVITKKKTKKKSKKNKNNQDFANQNIAEPQAPLISPLSAMQKIEGLVLDVKAIRIKGVENPHNASLVKDPSGDYLMAFRYDTIATSGKQWLFTHIGIARLDENFNVIGNFYPLDTNSTYSEDPRLFECMGEIYLFYNDLESEDPYLRTMHMAKLNTDDMTLEYKTNLDVKLCNTEKNWIPFFANCNNTEFLMSYWYNPHRVLRVINPGVSIQKLNFEQPSEFIPLSWEKTWGQIRGGTPALLVDGEYLAFFHSSIKDPTVDKLYYLMGAYTFSQTSPYSLIRISKFPILFDDIFSTPICKTGDQTKRVIFPAGYVICEDSSGNKVIHVSCGENDSGIKIVSLDMKILYNSLVSIGS